MKNHRSASPHINIICISFLLDYPASATQTSQTFSNLPHDVRTLISRTYLCDHLLGEISGLGDAHQMEIIDAANKACKRVDSDLLRLKKRYANDKSIIDALNSSPYDPPHEP